jgi:hypothetical protein
MAFTPATGKELHQARVSYAQSKVLRVGQKAASAQHLNLVLNFLFTAISCLILRRVIICPAGFVRVGIAFLS